MFIVEVVALDVPCLIPKRESMKCCSDDILLNCTLSLIPSLSDLVPCPLPKKCHPTFVPQDYSARSRSGLLCPVSTIRISISVANLFLFLVVFSLVAREANTALDRDSLELVWYDNFSGDSLDWDKWVVDEGDGCDIDLCDWGNGEQQVNRIFYGYPTFFIVYVSNC